MPKIHRSSKGKQIDMDALIAKNADTRAIGNMKVDARGNSIDDDNKDKSSTKRKTDNKHRLTPDKDN